MTGGVLEAHGIGGQADLPISLGLAISGAVAALVISFTVLVVAWRTPRYATGLEDVDPEAIEEPAGTGASYWAVALRLIGMIGFVFTALTAVFGENQLTNPFFGIIYVWLWVGVMFASLLFGPVWRAISPMRTINAGLARISGGDPGRASSSTRPGSATGRRRSASTRSSGWSWSTGPPPTSAPSGCGARSTSPCCSSAAPSSAPGSTRTPTRSRSTRRLVGSLSIFGRDDEGTSRCAARWRARP